MYKVFSRSTVLVLALICACFLFVVPAVADPGPEAEVSLEEAIGIAKAAFPVPAEFEQFNSDYSRSDEGAAWSLRWFDEGSPGGNLRVTVSAENGEILGFSFYKGTVPGTRYSGLPKHSREEALEIAKAQARKLQPERFAQTRLMPESGDYVPLPGPGARDYPVTYSFRFQRLSDGIPVVDNGISIEVNGDTGELQHFNMTWQKDLKLPAAVGRVGLDHARRVFNEDGLELIYVYTGSRDRDTGERPYLVYAVRDGRFVVDALTGKVLDPNDYLYLDEAGGMGSDMARKEAAADLSPAEAAVVEETRGFLSANAARQAAEAAYRLPGDAELKRSSLRQNWAAPGAKVWDFNYASEKEESEINLTVDARSGDLLRLSIYERQDYNQAPVVRFSEDQARQKAEAFMRKLEPDKAKEVTLRSTRPEIGPWAEQDEPLPRSYNFSYARLVNDIPYLDNGFSVTVNSTTGAVTAYNLNWWDTTFPQPEGVLAKDAVVADYLEQNPLTLEYTRVYSRWERRTDQPDYALIYRLRDRADVFIDAHSGQRLNRDGNPVTEPAKGFSDIAGHPAEQDILLLANAGIISGYGDQFRPDSRITNAELISMLVDAHGDRRYYPPVPLKDGAPWYEQSLERAVAMGIIDSKDQIDPSAPTTRLLAARLLVNAQGYGPLAELGSLFRLDAADAGLVPASDRGYAASAAGLGLLPLEGGRFLPNEGLTRGQTAQILVRSLKS